ncbi:hypothetical protein TSAR_007125 [Trichomalopsis sarcophagae]|uniref:Uncharacterized protein n=1 Tax=Trichomalopsis sarcophagae TaxID=543379 RepID=A0A232F6J4_9HYME|nr:hypothetical protein TSAR_007125 [Trichomalopsis sarcophagae]
MRLVPTHSKNSTTRVPRTYTCGIRRWPVLVDSPAAHSTGERRGSSYNSFSSRAHTWLGVYFFLYTLSRRFLHFFSGLFL